VNLLHLESSGVQGEPVQKPKYVYKTAEELIATGPTKRQLPEVTSELAKVKVIDMTGKEQRVLSGIKASIATTSFKQKHNSLLNYSHCSADNI